MTELHQSDPQFIPSVTPSATPETDNTRDGEAASTATVDPQSREWIYTLEILMRPA